MSRVNYQRDELDFQRSLPLEERQAYRQSDEFKFRFRESASEQAYAAQTAYASQLPWDPEQEELDRVAQDVYERAALMDATDPYRVGRDWPGDDSFSR